MGFEDGLRPFLNGQADWARDILCRLIEFRSTPGAEDGVQAFLFDLLSSAGFPARPVSIDEAITADPDYTPVPGHESYRGRPNILVTLEGAGGGRSAIVNTHTDIVPAPDGMFTATTENALVRGRGACDAKGQVATLLLTLRALRELGIRLDGDVEAQFVIEEEAGGNGSLSAIAGGQRADAAVVLEPTGLVVRSANRGAAWFRLSVAGRSVHMGRYREGVSAFDELLGLIPLLKDYESGLREASKGTPGFPDDPSPVVVNIGRVRAGDWPSTVPGECVAEGGIAFLPNRTARRIEAEVQVLIRDRATPWAREHARFELTGLRNEAFETPAGHPAVRAFRDTAAEVLGPHPAEGWNASCDARLFFHRGGMPTLVFGAGDLGHAHSLEERIDMGDIIQAAEVLAKFLVRWCGAGGKEQGHAS
ncbi:MAG: M20/M25/M40 family metallo-hydrolase [Candidatus Aminicenantales bacterium]